MKLAYIGTYPPRECGIGTFTMNLYNSMVMNNKTTSASIEGFVIALNDHEQSYDYPEEVKLTIRQEHQRDYLSELIFVFWNMNLVYLADKMAYISFLCFTGLKFP
jgi:hypothetical protein